VKTTTLCLLAFAAGLGRSLDPSRARAAERVVERHFSSELELATERFELTGSEGEHSEAKKPPPQVREQADDIELIDTYLDDEDPPEAFTRLYASVVSSFEIGDAAHPHSQTQSVGLEGKTVRFERERDGSYARTCDDTEVRPGLLKRLRADLSLACLLPKKDSAEEDADESEPVAQPGDAWELEPADLARLFSPLEAEVRRPRTKLDAPRGGMNLSPAAMSVPLGTLLLAPEGSATATLRANEEDDELPHNARLAFRLTCTFDGSETLLAGMDAKAEDDLELVYEGTGTLAWNDARDRVEITCKGEARLNETFRAEVEGNGKTAEVRGELVLRGPLTFEGKQRPKE
jgi:hypothetical protein